MRAKKVQGNNQKEEENLILEFARKLKSQNQKENNPDTYQFYCEEIHEFCSKSGLYRLKPFVHDNNPSSYKFYQELDSEGERIVNIFFGLSDKGGLKRLSDVGKDFWKKQASAAICSTQAEMGFFREESSRDRFIEGQINDYLRSAMVLYIMSGKNPPVSFNDFEASIKKEYEKPHWQFITQQLFLIIKETYSLEVSIDRFRLNVEEKFYEKRGKVPRKAILKEIIDSHSLRVGLEFRNKNSVELLDGIQSSMEDKKYFLKVRSSIKSSLKTGFKELDDKGLYDKEIQNDYPGSWGAAIVVLASLAMLSLNAGMLYVSSLAWLMVSFCGFNYISHYSLNISEEERLRRLEQLYKSKEKLCGFTRDFRRKLRSSTPELEEKDKSQLPETLFAVPYDWSLKPEERAKVFDDVIHAKEKIKTHRFPQASDALREAAKMFSGEEPSKSVASATAVILDEGKGSEVECSIEYEIRDEKENVKKISARYFRNEDGHYVEHEGIRQKLYDVEGTEKMWCCVINYDKMEDEDYRTAVMNIVEEGKRVKSASGSSGFKYIDGDWEVKTVGKRFGNMRLFADKISLPKEVGGGTILIVDLDPDRVKSHKEIERER
ncbi:MAG: hypothetical protein K0R25_1104 [Rickettsiaceae bacterium]|jgi:hypothetical protein|nr:hypothetical protein [Rickettsiaceae bacterium]